jgi:hypothetical protein
MLAKYGKHQKQNIQHNLFVFSGNDSGKIIREIKSSAQSVIQTKARRQIRTSGRM